MEFELDGSIKMSENAKREKIKRNRKEKETLQLSNRFFREFIFDISNNKCHKCNTKNDLEIHHLRYNWKCSYDNNNKKPNCEECYNKNERQFYECVACVKLLCDDCHKREHIQLKKGTGDWCGHATTKRTEDNIPRCKFCDYSVDEAMLYCPNCSRKMKLSKEEMENLDKRLEICEKIKVKKLDIYFKSIKDKGINKEEIVENIVRIKDESIDNFCSDKSDKELEMEIKY